MSFLFAEETVPLEEQIALKVVSATSSIPSLSLASAGPTKALEDSSVSMATYNAASPPTSVKEFDDERSKLYQLLDEKVGVCWVGVVYCSLLLG